MRPSENSRTDSSSAHSSVVDAKSNNCLTVKTLDSSDCVDTSAHADLRWVQRAHEFHYRPSQAWNRAEVVELESRDFDTVRYDEQTETLLCVNDGTLITVLSAAYETFSPVIAGEGNSTIRCVACGRSRNQAADECPHCESRVVVDSATTVSTQESR